MVVATLRGLAEKNPVGRLPPLRRRGGNLLRDFPTGVLTIGADPRKLDRPMTEVYGVGAFLLTGGEIYFPSTSLSTTWIRGAA